MSEQGNVGNPSLDLEDKVGLLPDNQQDDDLLNDSELRDALADLVDIVTDVFGTEAKMQGGCKEFVSNSLK
jgi:hypothetical protein